MECHDTRTAPSDPSWLFLRLQRKAESRTAARIVLRPDTSAMGFDHRTRNREPSAHATSFRGEERFEHLAKLLHLEKILPLNRWLVFSRSDVFAKSGQRDGLRFRMFSHAILA